MRISRFRTKVASRCRRLQRLPDGCERARKPVSTSSQSHQRDVYASGTHIRASAPRSGYSARAAVTSTISCYQGTRVSRAAHTPPPYLLLLAAAENCVNHRRT
ncbi:unnamed protein product [Rangifer tarandus platyrhynchus]|uniref:Uncharacterized protein n=1 Tax=Rangifer tarandus platyrhynchus TaxID=3082113 RepID=A0ABN8XP48_RANTA|nr:unnamed protein product [Rangifer tarandus platyrhynchus]